MMAMMATMMKKQQNWQKRQLNSMESRCDYSEFGMCVLLLGLLLWLQLPRSGMDVSTGNGWMYAWGVGKTLGHQARSGATPNPPF